MKGASAITLASFAHHQVWVGRKRDPQNGQVPYDARTGRLSSANHPATWATHDDAQSWGATNGADGRRPHVRPDRRQACLRDRSRYLARPGHEAIEPWAQAVIDRVPLNDDERQLSYLVKFLTDHRPGRRRGSRPPQAYPLPAERLLEPTNWWSRYQLTDLLFLYGARRRGMRIVVDE